MKKLFHFLLLGFLLLGFVACQEKVVPSDGDDTEEKKNPEPDPDPDPTPDPEPDPKDVTLLVAFTEEFSDPSSAYFDFVPEIGRDDFRYYPAFPSMTESGKTILMLRLDTADAAEEGAELVSRGYTWFGRYSVRLKIPDISAVQARTGACASLVLWDDDKVYGKVEIALEARIADREKLYLRFCHEDADGTNAREDEGSQKPEITGFNAASKFYIYGIDWEADKLVWWCQERPGSAMKILAEETENVPSQPLQLGLRFFHSKARRADSGASQAPLYPYELEVDWIKYEPF